MKKRLMAALLAVALTAALIIPASATEDASGFCGIGTAENLTITPNGTLTDGIYVDSDRLTVTYTAAKADYEYLVLLVSGDALPTASDTILYIDQATATSTTVEFTVFPMLNGTADMTLFLTSNDPDFTTVIVPVSYHSAKPAYTPGDINGDSKVNNKDLTRLFQFLANWKVDVVEAALDTNGDGKVNNKDLTRLFQYLANWNVELH